MILVTGAAGFCGSRIVSLLATEGVATRALVRNPGKGKGRLPEQGVAVVTGDTTQPETLAAAVDGVETIIHTAFITAERKQGPGVNYYDTNVLGTANLATAAQKAGVKRIVVLSGLLHDGVAGLAATGASVQDLLLWAALSLGLGVGLVAAGRRPIHLSGKGKHV